MGSSTIHKEVVRMEVSNLSDLKFLKELANRMGWSFEHERRSGLDDAIDDLKAGRIHKAKDVDDLMAQLMQ